MIFTSVDVEALRYLASKGEGSGELAKVVREHITFGYQTELQYQGSDGWFNAFRDEQAGGSLWLTAYCLDVFSKARDFTTIDDNVLSKAAQWIVDNQKADGSWEPLGFVYHEELLGGLKGNYALTAFVARALLDYGRAPAAALTQARNYLEMHLPEADGAHATALGAYVLAMLESTVAETAIAKLQALAQTDPETGGSYWEPAAIESTAYASLAFHERGMLLEGSAAAAWIAAQKNSRGGFEGTQDTVVAFAALVRDAVASQEGTDASLAIDAGAFHQDVHVDATNIDLVQTFMLQPGADVSIATSGRGPIAVQLAKIYHVPAASLQSRGGLELAVAYDRTRAAIGDMVVIEARVTYRGPNEKTNMTIAEIGIPTGLRPDAAKFGDLVGTNKIQRIDAGRRTAIVYLDNVAAGETIAIPIACNAVYSAEAAPAPSKAYDYYDPGVEALADGVGMVVAEHGQSVPFLRADATMNGKLELADAITMLMYLFAGYGPVPCLDAFDTDDGGTVNIADPIALLGYLFAQAKPPSRPFPTLGDDPTDDGLTCTIE